MGMISDYETVEWTNKNKSKCSYHLFDKRRMRGIFEKNEYVKFFHEPPLVVQAQDVFEIERIMIEYFQQDDSRLFLENCNHLKDTIRTALHIAGVPLYLPQPREYRGFYVIYDGIIPENPPQHFALEYRPQDKIKLTNDASAFATIEFVGNMFFPKNAEFKMMLTGTLWSRQSLIQLLEKKETQCND